MKKSRDEAAGLTTDWIKNGIPEPNAIAGRSLETMITPDAIYKSKFPVKELKNVTYEEY